MKKIICTMALALLFASGAVSAKAETFIESWSYSISGIFSDWSSSARDNSGIYTADPLTLGEVEGYRDLSWGPADTSENRLVSLFPPRWETVPINNYDSRSSITLSEAATGIVYTDGDYALGLELTHNNNSISSTYDTLASGNVYLTLTLEASVNGEIVSFDTVLSFNFIETTNTGSLQDDIFYILDVAPSMANFEYDGYWYNFSFFGSFWDLNKDYAAYVNNYLDRDTQYYGWVTKEGQTTTIQTYLAVKSGKLDIPQPTPTPEPGTVLLMGAGLAGLAFVTRRRVK